MIATVSSASAAGEILVVGLFLWGGIWLVTKIVKSAWKDKEDK